MAYKLTDVPELHGTIVHVEALYCVYLEPWESPKEPEFLRLTYADGRQIVLSPTGYEADGISLQRHPEWFDRWLEEEKPERAEPLPLNP